MPQPGMVVERPASSDDGAESWQRVEGPPVSRSQARKAAVAAKQAKRKRRKLIGAAKRRRGEQQSFIAA